MGDIDYSKLSPEIREKIIKMEENKPEVRSAKSLGDISLMMEEVLKLLAQEPDETNQQETVATLSTIRDLITEINSKEFPELPDYSKPIIKAFDKLEKTLSTAIKGIDVKPSAPQVNVAAPNVDVKAPDLRGVEKVLKNDIPKAFTQAIKLIPKTPETDLTPVEDALRDMSDKLSEKLESIDTSTRMKPQFPNTMKVTNPDGTPIAIDVTAVSSFADSSDVAQYGLVDADRHVQVDVLTMPAVTVSPAVGAATEAKQDTGNTSLASIKTNTDKIPALGQALAAASVPVILPSATITTLTPPAAITGFATSAKQDTLDTSVNTLLKPASTLSKVTTVDTITNVVHVDDNAGSLTVDGTVTANAGTGTFAVSAASLPLPTGAATSAKQDSIISAIGAIPGGGGIQYTEGDIDATITGTASLVEGAANTLAVLTQPLTDTQMRASDVKITLDGETVPVTGTFWQATQPVSGTVTANTGLTQPLTDTQLRATAVPVSGTVTANLSATDNAVLDAIEADTTSIDAKTPALGQALAAASVPVILPAATITTLTPPAAITGFATSAKQDTLLAELQLKADLTETQPVSLASVPSHAVTNAGTFAVQNTAALPAGTNNIGDVDVATLPVAFNTGLRSATTQRVTIATDDVVPVTGTFYQATQPVSAASLPLPAGAATAANQLPNNHNVVVTSAPTTPVTGTFWQATQPVSLASVPSHAVTNAGTFATQATLQAGTAAVGKLTQPDTPTLANVTMTGSSVTLQASNTARRNLMIFNDSGVTVYVKLGSAASATSFTVKLVDQAYYELPDPVYTGIVTALGASGSVRVTEVV